LPRIAVIALVSGAALGGGCSMRSASRGASPGAEQPERGIRVWVTPVVRWDTPARVVNVAIENLTDRTIVIAKPDAANVRVDVFARGDSSRLCGVEPVAAPASPAERVELAPGDRVAVRVDLTEACGAVPPGEYRFEVAYRSPEIQGERTFSGALATRFGELIVSDGAAARDPERAPRRRAARAGGPRR